MTKYEFEETLRYAERMGLLHLPYEKVLDMYRNRLPDPPRVIYL